MSTVCTSIRTIIPKAGSISAYLPEGLERGAFWQPAGRGWEEWRVEQSERDRSGNAPK